MADLVDASSAELPPEATAAPPLPLPADKQQQWAAMEAAAEAAAAAAGGGGSQPPAAGASQQQQQQQQAGGSAAAGALTGGLAYLQQSLPPVLSSTLSSLRGRLGLPASASGAGLSAQQAAAAISEEHDAGLLQLGERALAAAGGLPPPGAPPLGTAQLVTAARRWLATCSASHLHLGDLPVLMADYRRLARFGWAVMLR